MARWPNTRTDKHGRYVAGGRLLRKARLRKKRDAVLDLAYDWEYAAALRECRLAIQAAFGIRRELVGTPKTNAPYAALSRVAVYNADIGKWELK